MAQPPLTLRGISLRAVSVPLLRPLVTRVVTIERAPLLLIDLETEQGITGRAYLFGYLPQGPAYMAPLLRGIAEMCKGEALAPVDLFAKARKGLTLMGHEGLSLLAISGFDMACWDALAQATGQPLAVMLGGTTAPIPAYNSNGLGLKTPDALADEALALIAEGGFKMIKLRLGRDRLADDIAAVRNVRAAIGDDVLLPVDFNQGLDVEEAVRRGRALDDEGVYWIEEPIVYDDLVGNARIADEVATPIQVGENFYGPKDMARSLEAGACDWVMPDAERIGGVTGWLRAAAIAEAAGIQMSSHILPEISAHLMAVTPTAHWLEYVDWANPILAEPLKIENGMAMISDVPGTGVSWNEDGVAQYQIDL
ncbi:MAG: mandelate racemase [Rhodospirillaceae bacterium]|nr:mandelate racemase [Rhodospirillaceae bacterium]